MDVVKTTEDLRSKKTVGFDDFCISLYLTFRYIVKNGIAWKDGVMPGMAQTAQQLQIGVCDSRQVLKALQKITFGA